MGDGGIGLWRTVPYQRMVERAKELGIELPDYEIQGVTDFQTLASRIQARL